MCYMLKGEGKNVNKKDEKDVIYKYNYIRNSAFALAASLVQARER